MRVVTAYDPKVEKTMAIYRNGAKRCQNALPQDTIARRGE